MSELISAEDRMAVIEILKRELDVAEPKLTDDARLVEDLGADSLTVVEISMALEERFDVSLPDERIERVHTVGEIYELLAEVAEQKGRS